jgi:hypothetical protein
MGVDVPSDQREELKDDGELAERDFLPGGEEDVFCL